MTYKIMTFDGGGVRGVYTAVLLQRISDAVPGLLDRTELLAGTSTGGIIALGLASGRPPAELVSLYQDNAARIFDAAWLHELTADLHGLSGAESTDTNLASILKALFGSTRLEQLSKKVLVPSSNSTIKPLKLGCACGSQNSFTIFLARIRTVMNWSLT